MRRARVGRAGVLVVGMILSIAAPGSAETVRVGVHVTQAVNGHHVGGALVQLACPSAQVDQSGRTDRDGWAHFEFAYEMTHTDLPAAGPVEVLPLPRPNPVHGIGTVPYFGGFDKGAADASLSLYDLRGRVVAQGRLAAGDLVLPGNGAPAGVYLLRCRDLASGVVSSCRVTAAGGPLTRLRFATDCGAVMRRDPPQTFPSTITLRYPGARDRTVDVELMPGDQDLELTIESLAGQWPTETWLFASDHGWNAAAADSGWVPAIEDTALVFNHRVIDTDGTRHALAQWNASQPTAEYCANDILAARSSATLRYSPAIAPVIYFDFSDIPRGATVESAYLIVSPLSWSRIPCAPGAAHAATLDIWPADAAWLQAPTSTGCGAAGGAEHWRRTSWQYADAAAGVAWNPPLSTRLDWDEFGIHSVKLTTGVPGGQACRYDVTVPLQTWSDNRDVMANAGFVLSNWSPYTNYYLAVGAGSSVRQSQPLLVVTLSERPRALPWRGHALAFAFGTDDGDTCNVRYMDIFENHGARYTGFVMRQGVREFDNESPTKMTVGQWRDFAGRGFEIGHHSDHHVPTYGLAEITWGQVDSMDVELARDTWLEDLLGDGQAAAAVDVLAYPAGGVSLWAIKNLVNHGFIMGRCAGDGVYWCRPAWGNSGYNTYFSWYEPTNLFNLVNIGQTNLVGYREDDVTLDDIRLNLRRISSTLLNHGQSALVTFCHGTKSSQYANGVDYDELDMLLTAVEETGLYWIGTHGEIARCYREAHVPIAPGDGIGHATYDSLLTAGHQEFANVWWVLPDRVRR